MATLSESLRAWVYRQAKRKKKLSHLAKYLGVMHFMSGRGNLFLSQRIGLALLIVLAVVATAGWLQVSTTKARLAAERQHQLHGVGLGGDQPNVFATIKNAPVNVRRGPGTLHAVDWQFRHAGLPVRVLRESDGWYHIRNWQNADGWVHGNNISWRRRIIVVEHRTRPLFRDVSDWDGRIIATVEPGAVGTPIDCRVRLCLVEFTEMRGWIERASLWGINPGESRFSNSAWGEFLVQLGWFG